MAELAKTEANVQRILRAVLVLMGEDQNIKSISRTFTQNNFLKRLALIRANHVNPFQKKLLEAYTKSNEFRPSKVGKYPPAVRHLCVWVLEIQK